MKNRHWQPAAVAAVIAVLGASCSMENGSSEPVGAGGSGGNDATTAAGGNTVDDSGGSASLVEEPLNESTGGAPGTGTGGAGGGGGSGPDGGAGGDPGLGSCANPMNVRKLYMSADDSSSMGSPAVAREYLRAGKVPPPALIRPHEFLNYYRIRYPLPGDDKLAAHVHFAEGPSDTYRLLVGVQAFDVTRPKLSITFVVDTSGSLAGEGLVRERAAIKAIAGRLAAGDRVNFVTWATDEAALLEGYEVEGPGDPKLPALADQLAPGGGSDLHTGLTRGYDLAAKTYQKERLNRLVLISDGGANLGVLDRATIAQAAADGEDAGIHLVGVGLGPAVGYSDVLMNEVTEAGKGAYVYLDSPAEAEETLGERFEEVMDIAARNVQIAVTIPGYFDIKTSSGEAVSEDKDKIPPQHIAPGDSMVLSQVLTLKTPGVLCTEDKVSIELTWNDPLTHVSGGPNFTLWEGSLDEVKGEPWQLLKAEAVFLYARALQTGMLADRDAANAAVQKAKDLQTPGQDPYASELDEIQDLLDKLATAETL